MGGGITPCPILGAELKESIGPKGRGRTAGSWKGSGAGEWRARPAGLGFAVDRLGRVPAKLGLTGSDTCWFPKSVVS